jgi:hypothetical protein
MKKINQFIVWMSVEFSTPFKIATFILVAVSLIKPHEDKSLIIISTLIVWFGLFMLINKIDNNVYTELWPDETEDENKLFQIRGESLYLPSFVSALFLSLLSFLTE